MFLDGSVPESEALGRGISHKLPLYFFHSWAYGVLLWEMTTLGT